MARVILKPEHEFKNPGAPTRHSSAVRTEDSALTLMGSTWKSGTKMSRAFSPWRLLALIDAGTALMEFISPQTTSVGSLRVEDLNSRNDE